MCPETLGYLGGTVHIDISSLHADRDTDQIIEVISKVAEGLSYVPEFFALHAECIVSWS